MPDRSNLTGHVRDAMSRLAGAAFALLVAAPVAAQGPPPGQVRVDAARVQLVDDVRETTGEVRSAKRSDLAAKVPGLLVELEPREGDLVTEGDIVARLDSVIREIDVTAAEADAAAAEALVEQRRAEADRAGRDLTRMTRLSQSGSANPAEIDDAETIDRTARALLRQAEAALLRAEADLARLRQEVEDASVRAPFSGRVIAKRAEVGEWLGLGDPIIEIVSLDDLETIVDVPQGIVPLLGETGSAVTVLLPAASQTSTAPRPSVVAELLGVIPQADPLSRIFPARLRLPARPGVAVLPGMSVTALLPAGTSGERLTVHKDAILRDNAGEFVYAAVQVEPGPGTSPGENGEADPTSDPSAGGPPGMPMPTHQAVPLRVRTVQAAGRDRVVVEPSAVRPGTLLVIEGNERMFPTRPLILLNPPKASGETGTTAEQRPAADEPTPSAAEAPAGTAAGAAD